VKLAELLKVRGIDSSRCKVKVVRHQDSRLDIQSLTREEVEIYQNHQKDGVFDGFDYVASFVGSERGQARFFGLYRVQERTEGLNKPKLAIRNPALKKATKTRYHYALKRVARFNDLEGRLIVQWTGGHINWHQTLPLNMPIVQLSAKGRSKPFLQFSDVVLTFDELSRIVSNPLANADWHTALAATAGVYLIVDTGSGRLYVGSASGQRGILGRWVQYVRNGHGNNKMLKLLLEESPNRHKKFQYCILQTLSRSLSRKEVINIEQTFKQKFGKIACSLNTN
jgi:hypothetical protein